MEPTPHLTADEGASAITRPGAGPQDVWHHIKDVQHDAGTAQASVGRRNQVNAAHGKGPGELRLDAGQATVTSALPRLVCPG